MTQHTQAFPPKSLSTFTSFSTANLRRRSGYYFTSELHNDKLIIPIEKNPEQKEKQYE